MGSGITIAELETRDGWEELLDSISDAMEKFKGDATTQLEGTTTSIQPATLKKILIHGDMEPRPSQKSM